MTDREGKRITTRKDLQDALVPIYQSIYLWNPEEWQQALISLPATERERVLQTKSNLFWESLVQQTAERLFRVAISDPRMLCGLPCILENRCMDRGVQDAQRVTIRTHIDGRRDTLNPVTRTIFCRAEQGRVENAEVLLKVTVPCRMRLASPSREILDFMPSVKDDDLRSIAVYAQLSRGKIRKAHEDYPDYNLIFVPLRHICLQGESDSPLNTGGGISYSSLEDLKSCLESLFQDFEAKPLALARTLEPFMAPERYPGFGADLPLYLDFLLGSESGIAAGIKGTFDEVALSVNDEDARGLRSASDRK